VFPRLDPESVVASLPSLDRGGSLVVAYSGGLDSTVMLHLLWRHFPRRECLRAVHVNHGLQAQAGAWAEHCRSQCAAWGIPLQVVRAVVEPRRGGLEAAARRARYGALFAATGARDVVVTAQHADDQAETLLLQLLRGAGPKGLAGMPVSARRTVGAATRQLVRPLLRWPRAALRAYAQTEGLTWVEDPSNVQLRRTRNYLRHAVIPVLRERWPRLTGSIARSARLCAEAAALADDLAALDLRQVRAQGAHALSAAALGAMAPHRSRNVLRYWLAEQGLAVPAHAHMRTVEHDLLGAAAGRSPRVRWPGAELRRYRDAVFAMAALPAAPEGECLTWPWKHQPVLELPPGCGRLEAMRSRGAGVRNDVGALTVRFRAGGERLRPDPRRPSRAVKQLFQEAGVPPWVRERTPFLYAGDALLAVGDWWVDARWQAEPGEAGIGIRWLGAPPGRPGEART